MMCSFISMVILVVFSTLASNFFSFYFISSISLHTMMMMMCSIIYYMAATHGRDTLLIVYFLSLHKFPFL